MASVRIRGMQFPSTALRRIPPLARSSRQHSGIFSREIRFLRTETPHEIEVCRERARELFAFDNKPEIFRFRGDHGDLMVVDHDDGGMKNVWGEIAYIASALRILHSTLA